MSSVAPPAVAPAVSAAVSAEFNKIIERNIEHELKVSVLASCLKALNSKPFELKLAVFDRLKQQQQQTGNKRTRKDQEAKEAAPAAPPLAVDPSVKLVELKRPDSPIYTIDQVHFDSAEKKIVLPESGVVLPPPSTDQAATPAAPTEEAAPTEVEVTEALANFYRGIVDQLAGASNVDSLPARTLAVVAHLIDAVATVPRGKDAIMSHIWAYHFNNAGKLQPRKTGQLKQDLLVPCVMPTKKATTKAGKGKKAVEEPAEEKPAPAPKATKSKKAPKAGSSTATFQAPDAIGDDGEGLFSSAANDPFASTSKKLPSFLSAPLEDESDGLLVLDDPTKGVFDYVAPLPAVEDEKSYGLEDLKVDVVDTMADSELEIEVARILNVSTFISHNGVIEFLAKKGFNVTREQLDAVVAKFVAQGFVMVEHGVIYILA